MNPKSISLLKSACHYLLQALEVINMIEDDQYREFILKCRARPRQLRQIGINAERGSLWMTIFFILELLYDLVDE